MKTKCPLKWSEYKIRYEITSDLRLAKANYFKTLFDEVKTPKAYWNLVRKATTAKQQSVIGLLKDENEHLVTNDDDKACLMNAYFASVSEKLARDLTPPTTHAISSDLLSQSKRVLSFSKVD